MWTFTLVFLCLLILLSARPVGLVLWTLLFDRRLFFACVASLFASSVYAQSLIPQTGSVAIPWGDWLVLLLNQLAPIVIALIVASITWLCRYLPSAVISMVKEQLTQAKIARAVNYAFAKVEGAEKGKTLNVDHVDQLTAWAAQYGMSMFPQLVDQLGERFSPMILAKISELGNVEGASKAAPLPAGPLKAPFVKVPG